MSLADATALTSDDVRFLTQPYVAVEKLYAWSVIVDVFHGNKIHVEQYTREPWAN